MLYLFILRLISKKILVSRVLKFSTDMYFEELPEEETIYELVY